MENMDDGIYEKLLSTVQKESLQSKSGFKKPEIKNLKSIDIADSFEILSNYFKEILKQALQSIKKESRDEEIRSQIELCNNLIRYLVEKERMGDYNQYEIPEGDNYLLSIWSDFVEHERPFTPISVSSLFTGSSNVIALYEELKKEITTSDKVYFLVSFIKNSGINQIMGALKQFTERENVELNILTTTYMAITQKSALDRLARLKNTHIKISYNVNTTRLHAKAYIFKRNTGYNVAFVGSSNLSKAAMSDGMEWNVKLTSHDVPQIFSSIDEIYQRYWNSDDFVPYDPDDEESTSNLIKALEISKKEKKTLDHMLFDVHPYPYQRQVLADLEAEREVHDHHRNLVVAATGTGKTVITAFDYQNCRKKGAERLLFIAHRVEILENSMKTFQNILGDPNFGTICGGGKYRPSDHLFIMVQTLNSKGPENLCRPDYFDYIVIDEVHHGAAKTYAKIFDYFKPKELLGLTATPERMDGLDITHYFNDRIASEIRLAEAINRELVVPFQYYGITDIANISAVKFENGRLNEAQLAEIYDHNTERAKLIVNKVREYKPDDEKIIGLGFCVSIEHADFMANFFTECGYDSISVTSKTAENERLNAIEKLRSGQIKFIFTVDLFNEGVDIRPVNLELMLRPTESLTVFIQQLGRGLRIDDNKTELTVLDFVGQADKNYKVYARKLEYLSSKTTQPMKDRIRRGFSGLPAGCSIELEERAKEYVLATIETALNRNLAIRKVKEFYSITGRLPLMKEIIETDMDISDIYNGDYTFTRICEIALGKDISNDSYDKIIAKGLKKICFMDAYTWYNTIRELLESDDYVDDENRIVLMLFYTFFNDAPVNIKSLVTNETYKSLNEFVEELRYSDYISEMIELLEIRISSIKHIEVESGLKECPLQVYGSYYTQQFYAAIGMSTFEKKYTRREGVFYKKDTNTDYLFITLNKSEKEFSPTTVYNDYAINERLFHWESQNKTTVEKSTGSRYISGIADTALLVRKNKKVKGITAPFMFLGKGNYVKHEGNKPIKIIWEMENMIPEDLVKQSGVM